MKVIDYDEGVDTNVIYNEDGSSVTVYSFKTVELRDSCQKHQGLVVVDDRVLEWHEDCSCVS